MTKIFLIDYDEYEDAYDYCSDIDEHHALTGECKHNDFFNNYKRIEEHDELKDTKMEFCCKDHGYVFMDQCRVIISEMYYQSNNWLSPKT